MAKTKKPEMVDSLDNWSHTCGKERNALARALNRIGVNAKEPIVCRDVFRALFGEEEESRRRLITAEADLKEQKAARAKGETFYWPEIEKIITNQIVLPISQFLTSVPNTYDVRCNPHDPALARSTLEQLVDDCKKILREKMSEPRKE